MLLGQNNAFILYLNVVHPSAEVLNKLKITS